MTAKQIAIAGLAATIFLGVGGSMISWMLRVTEDTSTTREKVVALTGAVDKISAKIDMIAPATVPYRAGAAPQTVSRRMLP